ncbi:hypothetical protein M758_8G079200 [Ceratodon purpureus]|nr:hypothetical protein M758_8G079200 [Ceratodon purpureus]
MVVMMAVSASLNGAACILNAGSFTVKSRCVRFRNRTGDFFAVRGRGEERYVANSIPRYVVGEDLGARGLGSCRIGRFSGCRKLDATLRWRCGAGIGFRFYGRWFSGFEARCGSAGFGGDGSVRSSSAVLDVYLIRELLPPLVLGTLAFTVLGVSIGVGPDVMALVEKLGFSFRHCLLYAQIVVLRLPSYIALALPMASLLASLLAFGRLGVDSEVIALRAAGIGSLRMLRPTLILFMGITALHLLLAEGLTPRANQIAMKAVDTATASVSNIRDFGKPKKRRTFLGAFTQPVIYPEYREHRLAHLLYAKGFDGFNSLLTVTFVQMEGFQDQEISIGPPQSKSDAALAVRRVVMAEEATWDEMQGLWIFNNGCEYLLGRKSLQNNGSFLEGVRRFRSQYVLELTRAPLDFAKLGVVKAFEDMTIAEASRLLGLMKASRNVKESRKLQMKIQQRISLPFASIVFGLVGCLLSLNLLREQKRVGLALTLVIVFGYYSVSVFGSLIGQLGYVSPILGAWLPNLAGALLALALLFSAS